MLFGPKTKSDVPSDEQVQIIEALYAEDDLSDSFLDECLYLDTEE